MIVFVLEGKICLHALWFSQHTLHSLAMSAMAASSRNTSAIPSSSISTSSTYVCSVRARSFRNHAAFFGSKARGRKENK